MASAILRCASVTMGCCCAGAYRYSVVNSPKALRIIRRMPTIPRFGSYCVHHCCSLLISVRQLAVLLKVALTSVKSTGSVQREVFIYRDSHRAECSGVGPLRATLREQLLNVHQFPERSHDWCRNLCTQHFIAEEFFCVHQDTVLRVISANVESCVDELSIQ